MNDIISIINEEYQAMNESIEVFHGSDRKFDTFNTEMVGSGDGNSKGGWGIYFSTDEQVAGQYSTTNGFVKPFQLRDGKYFDLDDSLGEYGEEILEDLQYHNVSEDNIEQFKTDYVDYAYETTNEQAYEWLSYVLGSEKNASLFLARLGFKGNKFYDKTNPEATNYVVFSTDTIIY